MSDPKWDPMDHLGEEPEPDICVWTHDEHHDCWYPDCGEEPYTFNNHGPKENRFKFCPFCGKKLKEKKA